MTDVITREAQQETFRTLPEAIVAYPLSPSEATETLGRIVTAMNTGAITPGAAKALTTALAENPSLAWEVAIANGRVDTTDKSVVSRTWCVR